MEIVELPNLEELEGDEPSLMLVDFYEKLGWDSESEFLTPNKVKVNEEDWKKLCERVIGNNLDAMLMFVNYSPSTHEDTPQGKVYLEEGWARLMN